MHTFRSFTMAAGVALLLANIFASAAQAQRYWGPSYHSSTAAEGYARGWASIIRSQGQYHLDTSEAAKNYEEARSMEMDNRYKWTKTYFEMKELNRQYRAQIGPPRPSEEALVRFAQAGKPDRLSDEQVDPYTGEIVWPTALRAEAFEEYRDKVQDIFSHRSQHGRLTADQAVMLEQTTDAMLETLKGLIKKFRPNQYVEAKRFIESLAYEGQL